MQNLAKDKITHTLIHLLESKDIEKITVAQLSKEAQVSRALFYYYYEDIFAAIEDVLTVSIERITSECIKIEDQEESIELFLHRCVTYFPLLKKIHGTKYYESAVKGITQALRKFFRIVLMNKVGHTMFKMENLEFLVNFMSSGITIMLIENSAEKSIDEKVLAVHIRQLLSGYIKQIEKSV